MALVNGLVRQLMLFAVSVFSILAFLAVSTLKVCVRVRDCVGSCDPDSVRSDGAT